MARGGAVARCTGAEPHAPPAALATHIPPTYLSASLVEMVSTHISQVHLSTSFVEIDPSVITEYMGLFAHPHLQTVGEFCGKVLY